MTEHFFVTPGMRLVPRCRVTHRRWHRYGLCLALLAFPLGAAAQTERPIEQPPLPRVLKVPTAAFVTAATADWVGTYYGITTKAFDESTPGLRKLQHQPELMVAVGAAEDAAALFLWNRLVGRRHPKIAAAGLWVATALRGYMCAKGIVFVRQAG